MRSCPRRQTKLTRSRCGDAAKPRRAISACFRGVTNATTPRQPVAGSKFPAPRETPSPPRGSTRTSAHSAAGSCTPPVARVCRKSRTDCQGAIARSARPPACPVASPESATRSKARCSTRRSRCDIPSPDSSLCDQTPQALPRAPPRGRSRPPALFTHHEEPCHSARYYESVTPPLL